MSTSFATPKVTRLVGMIKLINHHTENIVRAANGQPFRPLQLPDLRILDTEEIIRRRIYDNYPDYVKTIAHQQNNEIYIRPAPEEIMAFRRCASYAQGAGLGAFTLSDRPQRIARILRRLAVPAPEPDPGYGAGIVSYETSLAYYASAGLREFLQLYCDSPEPVSPPQQVCAEIGPLYHPNHIDSLCRIGFNAIMYPTNITR
jgi:hypothetical protein